MGSHVRVPWSLARSKCSQNISREGDTWLADTRPPVQTRVPGNLSSGQRGVFTAQRVLAVSPCAHAFTSQIFTDP